MSECTIHRCCTFRVGEACFALPADGVVEVWSLGATPERLGTIQAPGAVALVGIAGALTGGRRRR